MGDLKHNPFFYLLGGGPGTTFPSFWKCICPVFGVTEHAVVITSASYGFVPSQYHIFQPKYMLCTQDVLYNFVVYDCGAILDRGDTHTVQRLRETSRDVFRNLGSLSSLNLHLMACPSMFT